MKTQKRKCQWRFLVLSVILIIVGIAGSKLLQTNFGKTDIRNVVIESESGHTLSMDLYIPENATTETKAPTILVQHGGNNNKEVMQHFCIEFARRGYVAVAVDMYGMGESEPLPDDEWLTQGRGLYDAVRYTATLPYVDTDRISLLGYSRGGKAAGESVQCDNEDLNIIKAVFLLHSDPVVRNSEGYTDIYGARDIAVLADKNDEYFFSEKANDNGTYSNDANKYVANLSSPAEYVINNSAQAFLYFGEDPANTPEQRVAETIYEKDYDGVIGTRQIFVSNQTHMAGWYSTTPMNYILQFFGRVMPTDSTLKADNYIYTIWNIFKLIALIGLVMFGASLMVLLVSGTVVFQSANHGEQELRTVGGKSDYILFWVVQVIGFALSVLAIWFLNRNGMSSYRNALFCSSHPIYHGLIALLCAVITIGLCLIWYVSYGKKHGFSLEGTGYFVNVRSLGASVAVVLISIGSMLLIVNLVDYFVDVNFLFVFWGFMKFGANRIPGMLLVAPLYIINYVIMSISVNCFNFTRTLGKWKWLSNIVISFIVALPTLFVLCYVYTIFKSTGMNPMFGGLASSACEVYALPGFVFVAILVCRIIYQKTGNPYLGGISCGIMAAISEWAICEIRVHTPGTTYAGTGLVYSLLVIGIVLVAGCLFYLTKSREKVQG